jgi:rare lipoprotein A
MKFKMSAIGLIALLLPPAAHACGRSCPSPSIFGAAQPAAESFGGQAVMASYYGGRDGRDGHRTASGEVFNSNEVTAAHRSLPFGSRVRVCFESRCAVVRINDRGPAAWTGRSLDLSAGAARAIGLVARGSGRISMEVVSARP